MHFLYRRFVDLDWNFIEIYFWVITSSGSGLAPSRCQATAWTDDSVHWQIYASQDLNEMIIYIYISMSKNNFVNMNLFNQKGGWLPCLTNQRILMHLDGAGSVYICNFMTYAVYNQWKLCSCLWGMIIYFIMYLFSLYENSMSIDILLFNKNII